MNLSQVAAAAADLARRDGLVARPTARPTRGTPSLWAPAPSGQQAIAASGTATTGTALTGTATRGAARPGTTVRGPALPGSDRTGRARRGTSRLDRLGVDRVGMGRQGVEPVRMELKIGGVSHDAAHNAGHRHRLDPRRRAHLICRRISVGRRRRRSAPPSGSWRSRWASWRWAAGSGPSWSTAVSESETFQLDEGFFVMLALLVPPLLTLGDAGAGHDPGSGDQPPPDAEVGIQCGAGPDRRGPRAGCQPCFRPAVRAPSRLIRSRPSRSASSCSSSSTRCS